MITVSSRAVPFEIAATPFARRCAFAFALVWLSALLIIPNLGRPRDIVFDEAYYLVHAQRYLNGVFFLDAHPPLGHLLIAAGEAFYHQGRALPDVGALDRVSKWDANESAVGYRLAPAFFGLLIPLLIFRALTLMRLGDAPSFLFALFAAFDNALIVQARAALTDAILIAFMLAALIGFLRLWNRPARQRGRAGRWPVIGWGAACACAAMIKYTGLLVLILPLVLIWPTLRARQFRELLLAAARFGGAFTIVAAAVWTAHFSLARNVAAGRDFGISEEARAILRGDSTFAPAPSLLALVRETAHYQAAYHRGVPPLDLSKPDEIGSPWYYWPFGGRAINYRWETQGNGEYRFVTLIGNPITWLVSLLGVIAATSMAISTAVNGSLFRPPRHRAMFLLVGLYWAYMIPMMLIRRVMYLYHYLPPLTIGLLIAAVVWDQLPRPGRRIRLTALACIAALALAAFLFYSPFTYALPLNADDFARRDLWPVWNLTCGICETVSLSSSGQWFTLLPP